MSIPPYIYNHAPRITLFGDPAFTPFLPVETHQHDFYAVETNEKTFFGKPQTTSVSVTHLKDYDCSFGKVAIQRESADRSTAMKLSNNIICINNIYNIKEQIWEEFINFRIEEDHGTIVLSWYVDYADIANNTLTMVVTSERPVLCIIED
jgi:hypothetical protein